MGRDGPTEIPRDELTGAIGPPDTAVMRLLREQFLQDEPLVESAEFDSVLHPRALLIEFSDGIGSAAHCRISVTENQGESLAL